jgi:type III pantothenate kinase
MLLAIDIGNTDTTFGVFEGEELCSTWHMATNIHRMADEYAALLLNLLHHQGLDSSAIKEAALCSVVPPLIATYEDLFQRYFHISPLVVGAGVKTGVRIRMDNPREVGADRIVNTAAAHHLYGGPVIITDLGTATTFDVVSKEGDYLGGAIAPGINTAAEALFMQTAMLPRVELVHPKRAIGSNTITAMQSGIVFGYVGLVEGMVARIQQELEEKAKVVATGGWAELIARETPVIDVVNRNLTLTGLRLIYLMNKAE